MPGASKDQAAAELAQAHFDYESGISRIVRLLGPADAESRPDEPIKLLEVNELTIPSGILPLQFDADPSHGIDYPAVIVEVTPDEFDAIQNGLLPLPHGWRLGDVLPLPSERAEVDS